MKWFERLGGFLERASGKMRTSIHQRRSLRVCRSVKLTHTLWDTHSKVKVLTIETYCACIYAGMRRTSLGADLLAMASILVLGILTDLPGRWLAYCLSYPLRFFCVFFISSTSLFILVPVPQSESTACVNAQGVLVIGILILTYFSTSACLHNSLYTYNNHISSS